MSDLHNNEKANDETCENVALFLNAHIEDVMKVSLTV